MRKFSRVIACWFVPFVGLAVGGIQSPSAQAQAAPADESSRPASPQPASSISSADRDAAVNRALGWLLEYTTSNPKLRTGYGNDTAQFKVVQCQTALLLTLHPQLYPNDQRRIQTLKSARQIACGQYNGAFTTWLSGFGTLLLAEESARSGQPHQGLESTVDFWINSQNIEGGWGHSGQRVLGDFYPSTLISSSNFGLLSLGAARHFGLAAAESDDYEDTVDEALDMYRAVQSPRGGLPYGARSYRKGPQAARTAASLIGLAALGKTDDELFTKGVCYVTENTHVVPYGHASPAMHAITGAFAFRMLGGAPWKKFQRLHFRSLLKCQQPDGTFDDFADSPDSSPIISSVLGGKGYRTASYALALSAHKSQWIKQLSKTFELEKVMAKGAQVIAGEHPETVLPPLGQALSHLARPGVTHLAGNLHPRDDSQTTQIALLTAGKKLEIVAVPNGQVQATWTLDRKLAKRDRIRFVGNRVYLFWHSSDKNHTEPAGDHPAGDQRLAQQPNSTPTPVQLVQCYDAFSGQRLWQNSIPLFAKELWFSDQAHFIHFLGNGRFALDLDQGKLREIESLKGFVKNMVITSSPAGDVFLSSMTSKKSRDGTEVWNTPFRGPRGTTPPAAQSSVFHAGHLFVTTTDGNLICLSGDDGKQIWQTNHATITEVVAIPAMADRVFLVGTSDGIVTAVPIASDSPQQALWRTPTVVGREQRKGSESNSVGITALPLQDALVVWNELTRQAMVLDGATGKPKFRILDVGQVLVVGNHIVVNGPAGQRIFGVN